MGRQIIFTGPQHNVSFRSRSLRLLLILSLAGLGGCVGSWPFASSHLQLDDAQFRDAWTTYRHCRSSSVPDEIRTDLQQLRHLAESETVQNHAPRHLPSAVRSLFATLPSRLAVDPQAMAAACALHGARAAQFAGRPEVSEELLSTVAGAPHEPAYAYYAIEAGRRLKRMNEEASVIWQQTQAPIQSSSE